MARVPEVTRDSLPPEAHRAFDEIERSRGGVRGPFAVLMHSPELARRVGNLGAYIRFESALGDVDRELAVLATAVAIGCEYEVAAHRGLALRFGARPEAVDALVGNEELSALADDEAQVVRFARELIESKRVSDETFEAMRGRLGDQGVVELSATVGYYALLGYVMNALEVRAPDDAANT